jgi:hypothetical protein
MTDTTTQNVVNRDVSTMSMPELSNALYHIAYQTDLSQSYTLLFCREVLLKASNLLQKDYYDEAEYCDTLPDDYPHKSFFTVIQDDPTPKKDAGKVKVSCYSHGRYCSNSVRPVTHTPCASNSRIMCICCEIGATACYDQNVRF